MYTVEPPLTATSPQRLLFCPGGHSAYIDSCLNLSTTAKAIKAGRHCQNDLSKKAIFFHLTDGKSRMVAKFAPYGALMINRGNRILIVFHSRTAAEIINCTSDPR